MRDFENQHILLGVSGGIAAYKVGLLIRELKRLGAEVKVVMTASAQQFVTPLTFQALSGEPVYTQLWDEVSPHAMDHITLARWADALVIVPATANCIAKMAQGLADDLLSTLYLVTQAPVFVCPAMNQSMWHHPATVENVEKLKRRGVSIVGPDEGEAACGETGLGRLCETETLLNALRLHTVSSCLAGKEMLITAGPTRERLDPVRYLSNDSSGKMGYALAEAARMAGASVTCVSGPTGLTPPLGVKMLYVESAQEMHQAVMENLKPGTFFIGAAAVADYRPTQVETHKIKKGEKAFDVSWAQNPDILADVAASQKASFVVGFAAETEKVLIHAKRKLINKKLDMIIANQVGKGLGFEQDYHSVVLMTKEHETILPLQHKVRLAGEIIQFIAAVLTQRDEKSVLLESILE